MDQAYRKERNRRGIRFLIFVMIWILTFLLGWKMAVCQDGYYTTVLLGKAFLQSYESAEEILANLRKEEQRGDYEAGRKFLSEEGYGNNGIRFLIPQHKGLLLLPGTSGLLYAVINFLWENRRSKKRCRESQDIIEEMRQWESVESGQWEAVETYRQYQRKDKEKYLPDTVCLHHAVEELMRSVHRKRNQIQAAEAEIQTNLENISHQMKTPLAGIQIYLEVLQQKSDPASAAMIEECHSKIEQLQQMVISLLHLAKLKAGKTMLNIKRCSVTMLVQKSIEEVSAEWEKKNLSIMTDIPQNLEIAGDEFWVKQALINVLRNAILYTPEEGSIFIRGREEENGIYVEIEDTGIGIPVSEREKVFERFYRREDGQDHTGNGIGLNLARQIMERMGGSLQARGSRKGTCMRFIFRVPSGKNKMISDFLS